MAALSVTTAEKALCDALPNGLDYDAVKDLHFLGNYQRTLPVNISRMMENAYDWEHLPFVHPSSFGGISHIASGSWGWRAKVVLPDPKADSGSEKTQIVQLLVDNKRHYWATTVLSGAGKGMHIHTQAKSISEKEISIDVRFYEEKSPQSTEISEQKLTYMQGLYAQLYDEDQRLMLGRQAALDRQQDASAVPSHNLDLGLVAALEEKLPKIFELNGTRFCLNRWQGAWIVYGAICPHLLGPLEEGAIDRQGHIICPWHGYRFDIKTGKNIDGTCGDLAAMPELKERDGHLIACFDAAT